MTQTTSFSAFLIALLCALSIHAKQQPNLILILSDDQGWNNTQVPMIRERPDTRSDYYLTPNLQRLADAGMTFSQAYAPHPVCSPSRHSIQFGITPAKLKKTTNQGASYPEPFPTTAIPQVLKAVHPEYKAAHFGKWHMFRHPAELGYDASDGRTGNQTGRQRTTDQTKYWPHEDPKRAVSTTDQSIQFITHQAATKTPFYLQISHYAIHLSAEASPASLEKHKTRAPGKTHSAYWYAAMIDDLDQAVGRILDTLDELQIAENTYVIFTSDNGGTARQYPDFNIPLKAGKGSYYEGGIRVPFFAVGPGIQANSYSSIPIVGYDLLPTFADLIGATSAIPSQVEGASIKSILMNQGQGSVARPRSGIHFYRQIDSVLIQDSLKLKRTNRTGELELFDLAADLSETENLANKYPEKAQQLLEQLRDWIQEIDATQPSPHSPRGRNASPGGNRKSPPGI